MFAMGNMLNSQGCNLGEYKMAKARGMSVVDRVGERYGRLTVLSRAENKIEPSGAVRAMWNCRCDCGNERTVSGQTLSKGTTKSCGCLAVEMSKERSTHGQSYDSVYRIWNTMKQRCANPKNTHWDSYGGRGIKVCDRWLTFENFFQDMGERPHGLTLERKDNERGYEPGNVIWASRLDQANNRRTNVFITYNGETRTVAEWGRKTGFGKSAIMNRLSDGWPVERALTEPLQDTGKRRRKTKKP